MGWYRRYPVGGVQKVTSTHKRGPPSKEERLAKDKLGEELQAKFNRMQELDKPLRIAACKRVLEKRAAYHKKHSLTDNRNAENATSADADPWPNRPFISAKQPKKMNYAPYSMMSASELTFRAFHPSQWGDLFMQPHRAFYGAVAAPPAVTEDGVEVLVLGASREPALVFFKYDETAPATAMVCAQLCMHVLFALQLVEVQETMQNKTSPGLCTCNTDIEACPERNHTDMPKCSETINFVSTRGVRCCRHARQKLMPNLRLARASRCSTLLAKCPSH